MKKNTLSKIKHEIIGAGPRIRKWRKEFGLKAFQLAEILKISQGSLSDIETGKSNPSAPTILKFIINPKININVYWMMTGKYGDIKEGIISPPPSPPQIITLNPGVELLIKCNK